MKKMMVAACAMAAAFAAVADGAPPSPRFLGFALGDKVDAAVCRRAGSILNVGGEAEYERKRQELTAKYKAEFAAYECDSGRGTKQFTIEYDDKHKCAEVVLAYILTSYPASRAYGIYAGR